VSGLNPAASTPVLERITQANASIFKAVRLNALEDTPSAFGSTYARESAFTDAEWANRIANWGGERGVGYLAQQRGIYCGIAGAMLDAQDPLKAQLLSMWVAPSHRRSPPSKAGRKAVAHRHCG
jgi:hypothetical protein